MPITYQIEEADGVVLSRGWGRITDADLLAHQHRLKQEDRFRSNMKQVFDLRKVTKCKVSGLGIWAFSNHCPFGSGAKRLFLVNPTAYALYGLIRMLEIIRSNQPDELQIWRRDGVVKAESPQESWKDIFDRLNRL